MKLTLLIIHCLLSASTFSQSLTDKYLHFKTDYYWDTILYRSQQSFYVEQYNGNMIRNEYPVLQYLFSNVVSDDPLVTVDSFVRKKSSDHPYRYIKKRNGVYLQYYDMGKQRLVLNKEYSLVLTDTVKGLANKSTLGAEDGIAVSGFSTYAGEAKISINQKQYDVYRFLESYPETGPHRGSSVTEVFVEKTLLIPVKLVTTQYDNKTGAKELYSYVTTFAHSTSTLPDYSNSKAEDLILYENKTVLWTKRQKEEFLKSFSAAQKAYAQCLLGKLDGTISYYQYQQNSYFRKLMVNNDCE